MLLAKLKFILATIVLGPVVVLAALATIGAILKQFIIGLPPLFTVPFLDFIFGQYNGAFADYIVATVGIVISLAGWGILKKSWNQVKETKLVS